MTLDRSNENVGVTPFILGYARPEPSTTVPAFSALLCGLFGGPVGCGIALIVGRSSLPESDRDAAFLAALAAVLGGAFLASILLRRRVRKSASYRNRLLANVGVFAAFAWIVFISGYVLFMIYALRNGAGA
jgi:hypothetical protein